MKICVIGAGACGLTSIKACKEEHVEVICYERSKGLGGLWNYNEDDPTLATVAKSTIINSSKEMTAFSDFPPDESYPNFMHNTLMLKYLEEYANKFDLKQHIFYRTMVVKVNETDDHESTGNWIVKIKSLDTNETKSEVFNSVMVCTGHHCDPIWPSFKNQNKFKGRLSHAHDYKTPNGFEEDRVIVVGLGNSGGDIAAELSIVSKKVFLSTRRGSWISNRISAGGLPVDAVMTKRLNNFVLQNIPWLACSIFESQLNLQFDHKLYGLKPKHRVFGQVITVNDSLPTRILSGTVAVKSDIVEFTENGVIFKGDNKVTEVESVVFATGYKIEFPFLDKKIIDTEDNKVNLYKFQYIPCLRHSKTLAIIGLIQPLGSLINVAECQARWHLQLAKNNCKPLPSHEVMFEEVEKRKDALKKRYYESKRHTIQVDSLPFMDEITEQFGAKPKFLAIFLKDPILWFYLIFRSSLPYQFRLNGPNSDYEQARKTILTAESRIKNSLKTNDDYDYTEVSKLKKIGAALFSIFVFILMILVK